MIGYSLFFLFSLFIILLGCVVLGVTFRAWYLEAKSKKKVSKS